MTTKDVVVVNRNGWLLYRLDCMSAVVTGSLRNDGVYVRRLRPGESGVPTVGQTHEIRDGADAVSGDRSDLRLQDFGRQCRPIFRASARVALSA